MLPFITTLILGCSTNLGQDDNSESLNNTAWNAEDLPTNRLLVQRRDGLIGNIRFQNLQLPVLRSMARLDIHEIEVPEGLEVTEVINDLIDSNEYNFVEPVLERSLPEYTKIEFTGDPTRAPNDPFVSYQTNMAIVQGTELTDTGTGIVVAVIDTGVATGGSDAPINIMMGYDFVNDDNDATDDEGHGTHVAGTIAQATNNNIGAMGLSPDVTIMPLKVLDSNGEGFSTDTVLALEYALNNGADVVNLSLGSTFSSTAEQTAINELVAAGVAVIAANGNDGITNNGVLYPAAYTGAVAISATNMNGALATYSNAGPETTLCAPGGELGEDLNNDGFADGIIQETINQGSYGYFLYEGTSMATPHVAAAFAALMGVGATASEAESYLINTAQDLGSAGLDDLYGYGEIRVQDAIDAFVNAQSGSVGLNALSSGDLVISEIMTDPTQVADFRGEWFEIYNNTSNTVDLNGLTVENNIESGFTVNNTLEIPANGYIVFGVSGSTISNGGVNVDQVYSYNNLKLRKNGALTIRKDSNTFDTVSYTSSSFGYTPGASISLNTLDATANDIGSNWCDGSTSYGDGDLGTPGSANDTCPTYTQLSTVSYGDLIITEIMMDPVNTADYRGEWFEIYNNTNNEILLNGLRVNCGGSTGFTVTSNLSISPNEHTLFAVRSNSATNGGMSNVDQGYSYSSCSMGYTDSVSISNSSNLIDRVSWNTSFSVGPGKSMSLGTLDADLNDSSIYWCEAANNYGIGDLGTPGVSNPTCPNPTMGVSSLGAGDLVVSEIMTNPTQVADFRGEWFEIYNPSGFDINLNGLAVSSSGNGGFTVDDDVVINNGDFAIFAVNANPNRNGGLTNIDFIYSYASLSFARKDDITLSADGTQIDSVTITSNHPNGVGASLSLDTLSATANNFANNWCESSSTYGLGDFGTPNASNDSCP